jgi:hypothetical protein
MKALARTLSHCFAAGVVGGLANSLVVWAASQLGPQSALVVAFAPALTSTWLYPRLVWGGLWGALFLLPIPGSVLRRGLLLGLGPALFQLFVVFPYWRGHGMLGAELGVLTPVPVIAANLVWGIAASGWMRWTKG